MPGAPTYGVVVYPSTSAAYRSEKVLSGAGYAVEIIPVPRALSTDCCLGLRFLWAQREEVQAALRCACVDFVATHPWGFGGADA